MKAFHDGDYVDEFFRVSLVGKERVYLRPSVEIMVFKVSRLKPTTCTRMPFLNSKIIENKKHPV